MPATALNILYCPSPVSTHESPLREKAKVVLLVNLIGRISVQEARQPTRSDRWDKLQERLGSTAERCKRCPPPSADTRLNSVSHSLHSDTDVVKARTAANSLSYIREPDPLQRLSLCPNRGSAQLESKRSPSLSCVESKSDLLSLYQGQSPLKQSWIHVSDGVTLCMVFWASSPGVVAHACNHKTLKEVEVEQSEAWGHPGLWRSSRAVWARNSVSMMHGEMTWARHETDLVNRHSK